MLRDRFPSIVVSEDFRALLGTGCDLSHALGQLCADGDSSKPLRMNSIQPVVLLGSEQRLPNAASDVRYAELCGMDCSQYLRFEVPFADADSLA
ncbi:hypothetical protein C7I55_19440 [Sphingomonas deserti]|uniref:Uncharacterized protein n=1 Tax=Allosphingosinicella deserti TaxID=2116704 RepID=A0A2P7QIS9_9SPHN|nr:hypothetical protein C7I55_19440 [Sphingomonas deserti]